MENLDYARLQMAFTLDFHIIFAWTGKSRKRKKTMVIKFRNEQA